MIERQQPYIRQLHVCINSRNGESKSCTFDGYKEVIEKYLTLETADQAT